MRRMDRLIFFFKQKTAYEIIGVTGVQTCALPILMKPNSTARSQQSIAASRSFTSAKQSASHQEKISSHCAAARSSRVTMASSFSCSPRRAQRSEERRVGKECRSVWATECEDKK